jgi:hypothetical protein
MKSIIAAVLLLLVVVASAPAEVLPTPEYPAAREVGRIYQPAGYVIPSYYRHYRPHRPMRPYRYTPGPPLIYVPN